MATINASPLRFDNGGILTIDGDDVTELIAGNAFEYTPCVRENLVRYNGDTPQAPRDGNIVPGTIRLRARLGASVSTSLYSKIMAAGTAGDAKEVTIVIKWPAYAGASTGRQATFSNVAFHREKTRIQHGADFDTIEVEGSYRTVGPTEATY